MHNKIAKIQKQKKILNTNGGSAIKITAVRFTADFAKETMKKKILE